jgi:hypothetical protein
MQVKRISSTIASAALVLISGVGLNLASTIGLGTPAAQAQPNAVSTLRGCFLNEPFTAKIAFNPTNVRQQPTTDSPVARQYGNVGQTITFSGINLGKAVNDAWDGQPDNMWYRIDGQGWIAGAVIPAVAIAVRAMAAAVRPPHRPKRFSMPSIG